MPLERHGSLESLDSNGVLYGKEETSEMPSTRRVRFYDDQNFKKPSKFFNSSKYSNMSVHEITQALQNSYSVIDRGRSTLHKLIDDLLKSKASIESSPDSYQHSSLDEVNHLLREAQCLRTSLEKAGERKKIYMDELSRLQATIHADRQKMEEWSRMRGDSNRNLQDRISESSKITREQQILIKKLKADNESLWRVLQEIQEHLQNETIATSGLIDSLNTRFKNKLPARPMQFRSLSASRYIELNFVD